MSQPAVENGVYNIKAYSGACLEFTSNQANLTLWNCDTSFEQQWEVQAMNGGAYSIQNVEYSTYISTSTPTEESSLVKQSSTPYGWSIRLNGTDQYVISPDNSYSLALNVLYGSTAQGTPVQLYMCCYDVNQTTIWDLFQFMPAPNSTSPSIVYQSGSTSTTLAIVFATLFGATAILCIGLLSWYKYIKPRRMNVAR
ncbi:hypothetical protein SCLCIDRAFT_237498 [Scleroderma citrinum Foug A]|uniref:Ricin B lectin domain-containing protein n=1 Tax=Scleroderma citrinum Foug A TaxID=1036808 RepID=A0A0C2Z3S2_9AGAM|nr:hypothetical protein SCLCIDRAFT_237498 [Scleroderma citrinum Foug A]